MRPEHSSARLERFLQLCAEDNIQVCNLTTPAQIFHALRRQIVRPYRKPLVVMTPKSLLRHKHAVSTLRDLAEGSFQRIIPDDTVSAKKAKRVLLCTGKVYYDLLAARTEKKRDDVAILRIEQLYPLDEEHIKEALAPYPDAKLFWVQEEPFNMGAWNYLRPHLRELAQGNLQLLYVGRPESSSPAEGSSTLYRINQASLIEQAFEIEKNAQTSSVVKTRG